MATSTPTPKVAIFTGAVAGDIAEPATADRIVTTAIERFGRVDTLINKAGVFISKPFTECTVADYEFVSAVNLTGFSTSPDARSLGCWRKVKAGTWST
jgi:NADP-dependent 3-hydroxy acid dehydrogenase YdfG